MSTGGYLIYDSTWPRSTLLQRDDITIIGVPLAKLCNENFQGVRSRILMKNIAYAGVLAALLDIDMTKHQRAPQRNLRQEGEPGCSESSRRSSWVTTTRNRMCPVPLPLRVKPMDKTRGHIMIDGNTAAALGLRVRWRHGWRLVSDHAVDLAHGCVQELLRDAARGPGNRQAATS